MKNLHVIVCLATALWIHTGPPADADINVRISVKAVINPATGMRQPGVSEATFANTVNGMNSTLSNLGRGYRIQWDGTLINVGGTGEFNAGPSFYYDINFRTNSGMKAVLESDAIKNPGDFQWDANAINIYVTRYGGANWNVCSFPDENIIILNGVLGYSSSTTVLHEIGHYFNLSHTMNGQQFLNSDDSACTNKCDCAQLIGGGSDGVADTKLDHECWDSLDLVAQGNFGLNANQLTSSQLLDANRIWGNVMSYHGRHNGNVQILTPDQLDRWTDTANGSRNHVVSGSTIFVDKYNSCQIPFGNSTCFGLGGPRHTVADGLISAGPGDIVLIRPGTYAESLTINSPAELRATRGNAILR
jgi:hypothetical protein